jgi:hypothetical protein
MDIQANPKIQLKKMKLTLKSSTIALLSVVTAAISISSSNAWAGDRQIDSHPPLQISTKIGCDEQFIKEFTVIPYITNSTATIIPAGTKIHWNTYWAGKLTGQKQLSLSSALAPGKTVSTNIQFSGDNNSCKAFF